MAHINSRLIQSPARAFGWCRTFETVKTRMSANSPNPTSPNSARNRRATLCAALWVVAATKVPLPVPTTGCSENVSYASRHVLSRPPMLPWVMAVGVLVRRSTVFWGTNGETAEILRPGALVPDEQADHRHPRAQDVCLHGGPERLVCPEGVPKDVYEQRELHVCEGLQQRGREVRGPEDARQIP